MTRGFALPLALALLAACGESAAPLPISTAGSAGQQTGGGGGAGSGGTTGGGGAQGGGVAGNVATAGGGLGGAGGAGAGGAQAGDAGGTGVSLVLPIERGDARVLELGDIYFEVKPAIGARITSLKLGGDELLSGPAENERFYGSTLWTSPADDWVMGPFDPPAVVDRDAYATTVADGVITAVSASSTANDKTFTVTKVFKADLARQAIVIEYQLKNTGAAPFKLSHWEVTRVFPDGLTFFQTGASQKIDFLPQDMMLTTAGGYTWYDNATHVAMAGESKAGAETPGGFIAHVAPSAQGDILFVKKFDDVAVGSAPTGHFEVELFCNDQHTYVELEDHSSFDDIAPGATYSQTVIWYVRRLPVGANNTPNSATLLSAVSELVAL